MGGAAGGLTKGRKRVDCCSNQCTGGGGGGGDSGGCGPEYMPPDSKPAVYIFIISPIAVSSVTGTAPGPTMSCKTLRWTLWQCRVRAINEGFDRLAA